MTPATDLDRLYGELCVVFIATLLLGALGLWLGSLLIQQIGRSTRPHEREDRVDLKKLSDRKLQKLSAWQPAGHSGSWSLLVAQQDLNRIRARTVLWKRRRYLFGAAWLAGVILCLQAAYLGGIKLSWIGGSPSPSIADIVVAVGWMMLAAWVLPFPWAVTDWAFGVLSREYTPPEWRVLERSSQVEDPYTKSKTRNRSREMPVGGRITTAHAGRILYALEAELLYSYARPDGVLSSEKIQWEAGTSRRLSEVITAKAKLLDSPGREVAVNRIYLWLDLVADVLITKTQPPVESRQGSIERGWANPKARRKCRSTLGISFWNSAAAPLLLFVGLSVGAVFAGSVWPFISQVPWALGVAGVLGTAFAGAIATTLVRLLENRISQREQ